MSPTDLASSSLSPINIEEKVPIQAPKKKYNIEVIADAVCEACE